MRQVILFALLAIMAVVPGCNCLNWALYVIAPPEPTVTKPAEFAELSKSKVAVLVFADMDTLYRYPYSRLEMSHAVAVELNKQVKDAEVIDPQRVVALQDRDIYWDTKPKNEIGQALGADYVLYVSLSEYSTREPGSASLARGRISAQCSMWDSRSGTQPNTCLWRKDRLAIVWPEDQPVGILTSDDRMLRMQMQKVFAEALVKNFYDHKVPKEAS